MEAYALAIDVPANCALHTLNHVANLKNLKLTSLNPDNRIRLVAQITASHGRIHVAQSDGPLIWHSHSGQGFALVIQDSGEHGEMMTHPVFIAGNHLISTRQPGEKLTIETKAADNLICVQFAPFEGLEQLAETQLSEPVGHFIITLTERFFSHVRFSPHFAKTQQLADLYIQSIKRALTEGHLNLPLPAFKVLDKRVERAVTYLESPETGRFDIKATANAALTSERNLFYVMKRQLGMTPYQFYLRSRLIQVRKALLTCQCEKPSISEHALSIGFSHLGRFSAQYQKMFGELPSTTLEWHLKNRSFCGDDC